MLRGCAQLRPNAARAEYRAWLAARPVGGAVTELIDAARGEDALIRGLAFEALRVVGAPAEPDVRTVADETPLRPYALLWLAVHDGADPEDAHEVLTREEATWLWVDTAAAVADHGEAPSSSGTWSPRCSPRSPRCSPRSAPSATPAPSRSWSPWPPPTPTRPSPRPSAAPPSRCTPEAADRETEHRGGRQPPVSGAYVPKLHTLPSASRAR